MEVYGFQPLKPLNHFLLLFLLPLFSLTTFKRPKIIDWILAASTMCFIYKKKH